MTEPGEGNVHWQAWITAQRDAAYREGYEACEADYRKALPSGHWPDSWGVLHYTGSPAVLSEWAGGLGHSDYKRVRDYLDGALRANYRNGYNDHARARAHAEAIFGRYPNQHGEGENP